MRITSKSLLAWVYALLIAGHAWVLVQLVQSALPAALRAEEVASDSRTSRALLEERIGSLAAAIDRALMVRTGLPAPRSSTAASTTRIPAIAGLPPELEALQLVIDRTTGIEERATELGWKRFAAWIDDRLGLHVPARPTPRAPDQLGRMARVACLTFLADRDRDGPAYPAALETLRAELEGNADHVALRLLALKLLRRLGPQVKENQRSQFVSFARNESAHGEQLVPDEAVANLVEVARRHPGLRADLHRYLWGVNHPLLIAELRDALGDPRPAVREGAIRALGELLEPQERTVLRSAREQEPDARLRALIDRVLAGP